MRQRDVPLTDCRCCVLVITEPHDFGHFLLKIGPIERGLITNLRRPDRNSTGIYIPQSLLAAKRLEIMREVLPSARRYLVLSDVFSREQLVAVRNAAEAGGLQLTVVEFSKPPYELAAAFQSAGKAHVEALITLTSPVFATRVGEIGALKI